MDNSFIISSSPAPVISVVSTETNKPSEENEPIAEKKLPEEQLSDTLEKSEAEQVVVQLTDLAQNLNRDLLFSVDDSSGNTILKVVDRQTEEVIREIPSEDIRRIKERMREVSGLLFKDST